LPSLRATLVLLTLCFGSYSSALHAQSGAGATDNKSAEAKPQAAKTEPAVVSPAPSDLYRIGVGDQLQISVWHEHDLSLNVVVRPDGVITMPLLNDLYVVGQTPKELAATITEKLKPFINEPQVTVSVVAIQSRKVYVVGQVTRQGSFALNDKKTVLELLTEAGGLGPFAKANSIYVLRVVNGKESKIPFQYKKVIAGKGQDIDLQPGDRVVVP
jgi:polysaccharide biosynthesis/export protein